MHKIASDDKTQNFYPPFVFSVNFDYSQFENAELSDKAKTTLHRFIGFVRHSFDGLLEQGQALNSIYLDCMANCPKGRKLFDNWLASDDFGASRYIAKAAIKIYNWFSQLPERLQRLVRVNVQKWSVSALRQLTKVSHDLVEELVRSRSACAKGLSPKRTAAEIKKEWQKAKDGEHKSNKALGDSDKATCDEENGANSEPTPPLLAPGRRIRVKNDSTGWNGCAGIIMSESKGDFWVLLDDVVAQGMNVKKLFKAHQLQPESEKTGKKATSAKGVFSAAEVEEKITKALGEREKERAEEELGRFIEIRDAALKAAKEEIIAARKHAEAMEKAKQELIEKLKAKEKELQSVRGLVVKNQQLEERIEELEKSLAYADRDTWGNTFTKQAAKVVNKELEKTIEPLMLEVERLNNVLLEKEQELNRLQEKSRKQQEELEQKINSNSSEKEQELNIIQEKSTKQQEELEQKTNSNSIISEFGEMGEYLGWNGWSSKGYRATNGMLYGGIDALTAFICDLKASYSNYEEEIPF